MNLDWNPKSLEGEYSKEALKLNEETDIRSSFYRHVQVLKKKHPHGRKRNVGNEAVAPLENST